MGVGETWELRAGAIITRTRGLQLGVSSSTQHRLVVSGAWAKVHRGIFAIGGGPISYPQALTAAVAWAGNRAVLSHSAAAWALGVDGIRHAKLEVELTVRRSRRNNDAPGVILHSTTNLDPEDRVMANGLPCTSLPRTLIDLCGVGNRKLLVMAYEHYYRNVFWDWDLRSERLLELGEGRDIRLLTELMNRRVCPPPTDSGGEAWCDDVLWRGGVRPARQYRLFNADGRIVARVDFAFPALRYAIEFDGFEAHKRRVARDVQRERAIKALGWEVMRVTWHDLADERRIISEIKDVLDQRALLLGRDTRMPREQLALAL